MKNIIKAKFVEPGMYVKGVGAELVNAVDARNNRRVFSLLHNRVSLTGWSNEDEKQPEAPVEIWVDCLDVDDGRVPVVFFEIPREIFNTIPEEDLEDEHQILKALAHILEDSYWTVGMSYWQDEEVPAKTETTEEKVETPAVDKMAN